MPVEEVHGDDGPRCGARGDPAVELLAGHAVPDDGGIPEIDDGEARVPPVGVDRGGAADRAQPVRARRAVVVPLSGGSVTTLPILFGKLPAHGDFVARGIDAAGRAELDDWLSASLADARAALGEAFAEPAAVAVQNAAILAEALRLVKRLEATQSTRSVVDHAIGIVMSRTGATELEALERLRTLSQTEHRKLVDVAQQLVDDAGVGPADRGAGQHAHAQKQQQPRNAQTPPDAAQQQACQQQAACEPA